MNEKGGIPVNVPQKVEVVQCNWGQMNSIEEALWPREMIGFNYCINFRLKISQERLVFVDVQNS